MTRFIFITLLYLVGTANTYSQTTFKGGSCGTLKWDFIGSYRNEGENLKTHVYLSSSDTLIELYPACNCDSSFIPTIPSFLVVSRTVLDMDNSSWNDSTKKFTIPRKEVFRDSIAIKVDEANITYHFWLDKNEDWFKIPPKQDIGWFFLNGEINYNRGIGVSPGFGVFLEGDLGSSSYALYGLSLNGELNRHQQQWIYGWKAVGEIHFVELFNIYIPFGAKVGYWQLTNGIDHTSKLTAEAGFSIFGLIYVMAGYNFNLNQDNFSSLQGCRFSLGLKKNLFLDRIRKDAKYNSNIEEDIYKLKTNSD